MQKPMSEAEREQCIRQIAKKMIAGVASIVDKEFKERAVRLKKIQEEIDYRNWRAARGENVARYDQEINDALRDLYGPKKEHPVYNGRYG